MCTAHRPIITGPVELAALHAHASWAMIALLRELIARSLPVRLPGGITCA
jgi:hypothetical protein